jgi:pantetheine-phosphate adenylyltransferase
MRAVYPGTFNPFTAGHADIAARALTLFDRVTILVAVNAAKPPGDLLARAEQVRAALPPGWDRVEVDAWPGLTATYCVDHGIPVIVRGVRNPTDALHEYELAAMNTSLGVETLLLAAQPHLSAVSSTAVRLRTDPARDLP